MPEKDYTFNQQLTLEFVRSQYGAVVMGVLVAPLFGLTLAALLAPLLASLYEDVSEKAKKEIEKLPNLQTFLMFAFPVSIPLLLPKKIADEIIPKIAELNIGNRLFSFFKL